MADERRSGADLWQLVEWRAATTPDAEVLVDRAGRRVTFAGLRDRALTLAAGLGALGVADGDTVAWELPTCIEAVELAAALHRLGAVQVPIIGIYRRREVTHCCRQSGARWLVTARRFKGFDFADMGARVADDLGLGHVVLAPGAVPTADGALLSPPTARPDAPRWIFYTSGTTSVPKGVRHTDRALSWVGAALADAMRIDEGDRYALVFPFPHIGGIILLHSALHAGCTHLLDDAFDPATSPAFLARQGVTHAGTGTPFHLAYLAAQRADPGHRLFPHLKCCPGGAAPKPPTLHQQIKRELGGVGIVSSWGLTEAPILTCSRFDDTDDKLASTEGRALPGVHLRAVTADGTVARTGEEGELQVKAPQVTVGYVNGDLDADAFTDGWLRTGDLGVIDDGGYVRITGRLKDVIIRNGENVSAREVEDLLFTHPSVADAAVVGIPDTRTGERVCAVVTTADGAAPLRFVEMVGYLRELGLRAQAIPERLEHVESLPRNPAGKVLKQELADRVAAVSGRRRPGRPPASTRGS
jgi:acyl-CoA synthetase (AMP-forming)/AMP-acid ligase II